MLRSMIWFWVRWISPRLKGLITTLGTAGFLTCLLLLWAVAKLSREVWERESFAFDTSILLWIHQWASPPLDAAMLAITQLANPAIALILTLIPLIILWFTRRRIQATWFLCTLLGGAALNIGLKLVFIRPRPQLWPHLIVETSYSFPSGHALGSMVLYGAIAHLLTMRYQHYAGLIYGIAGVAIALIGFSRLYLGVHWPTDIVAGYSIGFLWLTICTNLLNLQAPTDTDPPPTED